MTYTAWSVSFGEQPSAAKWNILGTNDASFNDGTGIANLSMSTTALSHPYKFRAYRSAAWSIAGSTTAKVQFDAESFDTNSNYDSATNYRYTAPVAGFYWFNSFTTLQGIAGATYVNFLYKNGSQISTGMQFNQGANNSQVTCSVASLLQLSATDYVEVYMFNGNGSAQSGFTGTDVTHFEGWLVSRT